MRERVQIYHFNGSYEQKKNKRFIEKPKKAGKVYLPVPTKII